MATSEEKVAAIEEIKREFCDKAKQFERDGDYFTAALYRAGAHAMESDKMFRVGDNGLDAYRKVIQDACIEINGARRPLDTIISK